MRHILSYLLLFTQIPAEADILPDKILINTFHNNKSSGVFISNQETNQLDIETKTECNNLIILTAPSTSEHKEYYKQSVQNLRRYALHAKDAKHTPNSIRRLSRSIYMLQTLAIANPALINPNEIIQITVCLENLVKEHSKIASFENNHNHPYPVHRRSIYSHKTLKLLLDLYNLLIYQDSNNARKFVKERLDFKFWLLREDFQHWIYYRNQHNSIYHGGHETAYIAIHNALNEFDLEHYLNTYSSFGTFTKYPSPLNLSNHNSKVQYYCSIQYRYYLDKTTINPPQNYHNEIVQFIYE